jgi:hypothetical protein
MPALCVRFLTSYAGIRKFPKNFVTYGNSWWPKPSHFRCELICDTVSDSKVVLGDV